MRPAGLELWGHNVMAIKCRYRTSLIVVAYSQALLVHTVHPPRGILCMHHKKKNIFQTQLMYVDYSLFRVCHSSPS